MILAIDIGNSNIVLGLCHDGKWSNTFRYETKEAQPEFYYENSLRNILLEWGISSSDIIGIVISSVVPDLNQSIREAVENVTGKEPVILGNDVYKSIDFQVPHPYEIGSDIVSNAYGALCLYDDHCIIVDFGTALTFTIVDKNEGIKGVSIVPGLKTAIQSLSTNTALLPIVPLALPSSAIGHDTVSAIQSGVLWGYVGLVTELLRKIKSELPYEHKVIATGGLSDILQPLANQFDQVNKNLTLDGMRFLYELYVKK
ncbi:MAG TPA: type III pantothenate kinase [Saprospiraceae bacterium]|nr:type III pantothenate kinase [Saprospiraceae bacterium]